MNKNQKWLIGGLIVVGAGVVWYVMRRNSQSQAANQTGIDPTTGMPYASEMYGGYGMPQGTTPSLYGYVDPTTGAFISGAGAGSQSVIAPTTNASWAQDVESYLTSLGYDAQTVAAALGKYLTGQKMTADQAAIVAAAQGFYGNPPQGAPPPVTTPPPGQNGEPAWLKRWLAEPILKNPTAAQLKAAFAKGRRPDEIGSIYIKGKWYRVPIAGH